LRFIERGRKIIHPEGVFMKFRIAACILFFTVTLFSVFPEESNRTVWFAEQVCSRASLEWKTVFYADLATLLSDVRVSDYAMKVAMAMPTESGTGMHLAMTKTQDWVL